jgi:hypothetical protein
MFCCVVFYDDMIHIKIFSFLANCDLYSFLLHFFGGSFIRVQLHRLLHDYEQCHGLGGSVWVAIWGFFFFYVYRSCFAKLLYPCCCFTERGSRCIRELRASSQAKYKPGHIDVFCLFSDRCILVCQRMLYHTFNSSINRPAHILGAETKVLRDMSPFLACNISRERMDYIITNIRFLPVSFFP